MQRVKMIAAVGLVQVAIGIVQLPLPAGKAGIVARSRGGIQTQLAEHACTNMVVVKVAADSQVSKAISFERNTSLEPPMVSSLGWLKS